MELKVALLESLKPLQLLHLVLTLLVKLEGGTSGFCCGDRFGLLFFGFPFIDIHHIKKARDTGSKI